MNAEGRLHLGVVGVGLIGGSLIKSVRASHPDAFIVAIDASEKTRGDIKRDGVANHVSDAVTPRALADCNLVVLCTPVADVLTLLGPVSKCMPKGSIISDVAGVKAPVASVAAVSVQASVAFVGAHPMFGGEGGGYSASDASRWPNGRVAVCSEPSERESEPVVRVAAFHTSLGAVVVHCTPTEHDRAVAVVSHLPYLWAKALTELASLDPLAMQLAGGSFRDATRVARFAYDVQGDVVRRNPFMPGAIQASVRLLEGLGKALQQSPEAAREALSGGDVDKT